ncbi:hypothetical protein DYB28_002300 [Aphanomyces astaci]|uniref:Uncharacterized protein n=1 Tax=Aphanomyces astaci TaxID=112090 RepID=A0A9X8E092_APHAT|nr:hypothetical protein DYB28_002300 [Aphanomyces astaci]
MKSHVRSKLTAGSSSSAKAVVPHINRLYAVAGLGYMYATIFGSVTHLSLTQVSIANDSFWANYNSSR